MEGESLKPSPSRPADVLTSDESPLSSDEAAVCRRTVGKLHFYARGTRWDISHAVSRCSGKLKSPTVGLMKALQNLCGYLCDTVDFKIGGARPATKDVFHFYSDLDHHGDKTMSSKSQTGVVILLNGIPVHWCPNRQPVTAGSPAASVIYALKDSVRDGRLLLWVADELGLQVQWPFVVQVDSNQAQSFQQDTCAKSRTRGAFDLREDWVRELRDGKTVSTKHVSTDDNLADMFTETLPIWKFQDFVSRIQNSQSVQILGGQVYFSFMCDCEVYQ